MVKTRVHKKTIGTAFCTLIIGTVLAVILLLTISHLPKHSIAGGNIHASWHIAADMASVAVNQSNDNLSSERFQRPSPNPYTFADFQNRQGNAYITQKFDQPQDVILAYYGILTDASNMVGYSGGCGTIGWADQPYPYAYELLTKEKQETMSFKEFKKSFKGIGFTTLLKLIPVDQPPGTPANIKYYMVEYEVITGTEAKTDDEYNQGSQFAYYYGLVTVENTKESGWKIKDIDYIPEDFLCAPTHHWDYDAEAVVNIVYGENLKLIDQIDNIEKKGDMVYVYASGSGKQYRLDFVRLTNGYDILLYENILEDGQWKNTDLLTDDWKNLKLFIDNGLFTE